MVNFLATDGMGCGVWFLISCGGCLGGFAWVWWWGLGVVCVGGLVCGCGVLWLGLVWGFGIIVPLRCCVLGWWVVGLVTVV